MKDYAASWVSRKSWRLSSLECVTLVLNSQVIPQFGDRELRAVSASDVQAWVWEMSKTLAPSTVDSYFRVLVALMRSAEPERFTQPTDQRCEGSDDDFESFRNVGPSVCRVRAIRLCTIDLGDAELHSGHVGSGVGSNPKGEF